MLRFLRPRWPLQLARYAVPVVVACSFILTEYAASTASHWTTPVRALVLAACGAAALQAATWLVLRNERASITVATASTMILLGGTGFMLVTGSIALAWLLFAIAQRLRRRPPAPYYHPIVTHVAMITCALSLVTVATSGVVVFAGSAPQTLGAPSGSGPNIYVLILDGYARGDTLAGMGFDNQPFLDELASLGFDVYHESRSNYSYTGPTLASMLNLSPAQMIADLPPAGSSPQKQAAALLTAMNEGSALDLLRREGYTIVSVPPILGNVALTSADHVRDPGTMNDFERHVLTGSALAGIFELLSPDWIAEQHRARIRHAFAQLRPEWPGTFVWAHVMVPHAPFVFHRDGEQRPMPECFPRCWFWSPWIAPTDQEIVAGYLEQLRYTNGEVLDAVREVVATDEDAVIVVLGDHGSRLDEHDKDEWFRNLLAVRSPGQPQLLGDAPTTTNVLPLIFNAYLRQELPTWPDSQFLGSGSELSPYREVR